MTTLQLINKFEFMIKTLVVIVALFLVHTTVFASTTKEESLRYSVRTFNNTWNEKDFNALANFWIEDGDYIDSKGTLAKGHVAIERQFEKEKSNSDKIKFKTTNIRWLNPNSAAVDIEATVDGTDGKSTPTPAFHIFCIAVKEKSGWQWTNLRQYKFSQQ